MKTALFLMASLFLTVCLSAQEKDSTVVYVDYGTTKDTVGIFRKVEMEAQYPGGLAAWRNYLMHNLNAYAPLKDLSKKVKHFEQTAVVQFIVCTDGSICDVKVVNDVLPSIKKEAEKAIKKSGAWMPAEQSGKKVKAYRQQPITFIINGN
jgi:protein TonB